MTEISGLYSIECFNTRSGLGLGGYGPPIVLHKAVVKAIVNLENKRDEKVPLYKMVLGNLKDSTTGSNHNLARLDFYEDTWFLTTIVIGSGCACFGIGGDGLSSIQSNSLQNIRYSPHNIDSAAESSLILSTWLLWFNNVVALTDFELPHAM